MKKQEAQSVYWLTKEIEMITNNINKFKHTEIISEEEKKYSETLEKLKIKLTNEKIRIEKEIELLEDPRVRIIARRRFIDLKSWEFIAKEMHYDTSTIQKLLWKELN